MQEKINLWKQGLSRTSKATFGRIASIFGATEIREESWENLETLLIQADLGIQVTQSIVDSLHHAVHGKGLRSVAELQSLLESELLSRLEVPPVINLSEKPSVVLIVGVNGSGKTTTAAKLGYYFEQLGKRVVLIGADTFRAAATDQLQVWADRLKIPFVVGHMGSDPGAVTFDGIQSAITKGSDLAVIDTAGRLHTRFNLMEELKKVHRVAGKALPGAPHAVWLVLDATTGQNALQQAKSFKEAVNVTGIILSKLDTSARGGMAFAIQKELGLPILFAGLGEKLGDLIPFDPGMFVKGILAS